MPTDPAAPPRRHLLIAGTGRAGTSFLVRYLTHLGLETHLSRTPAPEWNHPANAGFEDLPLPGTPDTLPYVAKSPWLYEHIDALLRDNAFGIDAVIIPLRDLAEAAVSRIALERRAMHAATLWMADLDQPWETWGQTPGGVVFSLNPIDQGRLLAVAFHRLVQRLVRADIPVVFLDFPRLAQDAAYLFTRLRPYLPQDATEAAAGAVHATLAEAGKIRVGDELQAAAPSPRAGAETPVAYPDSRGLDRIALARELQLLRPVLAEVETARQRAVTEAEALRAEVARLHDTAASLQAERIRLAAESAAWRADTAVAQAAAPADLPAAARADGAPSPPAGRWRAFAGRLRVPR
ncbi:MAG TPA: hypothetical protein VNE67_02135 [Acetobacteraceae bacterium]|nr:hypothetical protein [Acetobacteraceae bacterium]